MEGYPVSIVVPVSSERFDLYRLTVEPLIRAMLPAAIIPIFEHGTAPAKRNLGASRVATPFVLFCDDDIIWHPDALGAMLGRLTRAPKDVAYCYTNFMMINHPTRGTSMHDAGAWDADRLKRENFISTMSLIRMDAWHKILGWDESLTRLQDWDIWLQFLNKSFIGVYLPVVAFSAIYSPTGITQRDGYLEAYHRVRGKHHL